MDLSKDEMAILLDGLAALPLARSYNLFQKLLVEMRKGEEQQIPLYAPQEPSQGLNGAAHSEV